jgi:hypothetical protein
MKELELALKMIGEAPEEIKKVCEPHLAELKVLAPTQNGQDVLSKIFTKIFLSGMNYGLDIAKELAK